MNKAFEISFSIVFMYVMTYMKADEKTVFIHDASKTLQAIADMVSEHQKGAYLSFDKKIVEFACNESIDKNHKYEIQQILALTAPTILKAFPLEFFNWSASCLSKITQLHEAQITDVYSDILFQFLAIHDPDICIKTLHDLKKDCCIIIGYETIPVELRNALCRSGHLFIPVPLNSTYALLNDIEKQCIQAAEKDDEYKVIITALGSYGPLLQKRLWHRLNNVFLLDLDGLIKSLITKKAVGWASFTTTFDTQKFIDMLAGDVKIVCTSALLNRNSVDNEQRKQEYVLCLNSLRDYGYSNPYIVESIASGPTFFEQYTHHVCYSKVNETHLNNKGVNESKSLLKGFEQFGFNDNDIIVKMTGRYLLNSDTFLRYIEDHPTVDAFVHVNDDNSIFTGCFALRYKYFKRMLNDIDYVTLEKNMKPIEWEVFDYLKMLIMREHITIACLDHIDMSAAINYPLPGYTLMQF